MSHKKLMFITEKGFINKKHDLLFEIPYDKIDEVKIKSEYKLGLRDDEDNEHEFNADIPVSNIIKKLDTIMH